jgi:starch synthase
LQRSSRGTDGGDAVKGEPEARPPAGPRVLLVSPEIHPLAKTGGLADVAGSLPLALRELGADIRVAMPRYRKVAASANYLCDFPVPMGKGITETAVVKEAQLGQDVPAYLVENYRYFDRDALYGHGDDAERFGFFSRAVLEMFGRIGWTPDVIHCNDWQSALIPTYLKFRYRPAGRLKEVGTLFTIHNMEYQGGCPPSTLDILDLGWEFFTPRDVEFFGAVNLMKAGILYSDMVSTVSEGYAREIQTPEYGGRLEGVLAENAGKLRGILNGLDYNVWNPDKDAALEARFSARSAALRARNKAALQRQLGLEEDPARMLLGFVGRMTIQKGVDILVPAVPAMLKMGAQLAVLGSGDEHYQDMMKRIAGEDPAHLKVVIGFDDRLARRIYGGCDAFLMPSRYEPCGLGQMISFRYGAVPIVRRTGGLADTVSDASVSDAGTGFVFNEYTTQALAGAVERAMQAYSDRPRWSALVMRGMAQDFSWRASAGKYIDTYREIMRLARQGPGR